MIVKIIKSKRIFYFIMIHVNICLFKMFKILPQNAIINVHLKLLIQTYSVNILKQYNNL